MIKIILTQKVDKLGSFGDIVSVKNGYARNYLIPLNLADYATQKNIDIIQEKKIKLIEEENKKILYYKNIFNKINNKKIVIFASSGENDKLFGSISSKNIIKAIYEETKIELHNKNIIFPNKEVIKTLGNYNIRIHIYKDIYANISLIISKSH